MLQPHFERYARSGPGNNVIRWVGTESGLPSYPLCGSLGLIFVRACFISPLVRWSTAQNSLDYGAGEPNGTQFVPAEVHTHQLSSIDITSHCISSHRLIHVLHSLLVCQHVHIRFVRSFRMIFFRCSAATADGFTPEGGCWFYDPTFEPKSLQQLIQTYHQSVGQNAFLLVSSLPFVLSTLTVISTCFVA